MAKPMLNRSSRHVEQIGGHILTNVPGNDSLCLFNAVWLALQTMFMQGKYQGNINEPREMRAEVITKLGSHIFNCAGNSYDLKNIYWTEEYQNLLDFGPASEVSAEILAEIYGVNIAIDYIDQQGNFMREIQSRRYGTAEESLNINVVLVSACHYMLLGDSYAEVNLETLWKNAEYLEWGAVAASLGMGSQPVGAPSQLPLDALFESDKAMAAQLAKNWHNQDIRFQSPYSSGSGSGSGSASISTPTPTPTPTPTHLSLSDITGVGQDQDARAIRAALKSDKQVLEAQSANLKLALEYCQDGLEVEMAMRQFTAIQAQLERVQNQLEGLRVGNQTAHGLSDDTGCNDAIDLSLVGYGS